MQAFNVHLVRLRWFCEKYFDASSVLMSLAVFSEEGTFRFI